MFLNQEALAKELGEIAENLLKDAESIKAYLYEIQRLALAGGNAKIWELAQKALKRVSRKA